MKIKYQNLIKNINQGNFQEVNAELSGISDISQLISDTTFMHRNTILHYVFSSGNEQIITLFLNEIKKAGLDYETLIAKQNQGGYTPIDRLLQKEPSVMQVLLSAMDQETLNKTLKAQGIGGTIQEQVQNSQYLDQHKKDEFVQVINDALLQQSISNAIEGLTGDEPTTKGGMWYNIYAVWNATSNWVSDHPWITGGTAISTILGAGGLLSHKRMKAKLVQEEGQAANVEQLQAEYQDAQGIQEELTEEDNQSDVSNEEAKFENQKVRQNVEQQGIQEVMLQQQNPPPLPGPQLAFIMKLRIERAIQQIEVAKGQINQQKLQWENVRPLLQDQLGQQLQEQLQEFNSQFTTQVQQKLEELKQSAGNEQHKTQFDIWLNQELKTPQLDQQLQEQFSALQAQQIIQQAELQRPLSQLQEIMQQLARHVGGQQGQEINQAVLTLLYDTATQFSGQEVEEGVKLTFADMNQEEQSIFLIKQDRQVQVVEQAEDAAEVGIRQLQVQYMGQQITEVEQYIEQQVWQYLTDKAEILRIGQEAIDITHDRNNELATQYNQLVRNFKQKYLESPFAQALQLANPGLMGNGMPEQLPYQLFGESDKYGEGTSIEDAENMLQKLSGQYGNVQGAIIWNVDNKYVLIVDTLPSDMQERTIYLGIQSLQSSGCVPLTLEVMQNLAPAFSGQTLSMQIVKLDNGVLHARMGITGFENQQQQWLAAQYISGQHSPLNENRAFLSTFANMYVKQVIAADVQAIVDNPAIGYRLAGEINEWALVPVGQAGQNYQPAQSFPGDSSGYSISQWIENVRHFGWREIFQSDKIEQLKSMSIKSGAKTGDSSINKIYRAVAKVLHPDKGGNPEKMVQLNGIKEELDKTISQVLSEKYDLTGKVQWLSNIAHKGVVALKTVDSAVDVWKLWNEPTAENTLTIGLDAGHLYSLAGMPKAGWVSVGTSALPISYALYQGEYWNASVMTAETAAYLALPYTLGAIPVVGQGIAVVYTVGMVGYAGYHTVNNVYSLITSTSEQIVDIEKEVGITIEDSQFSEEESQTLILNASLYGQTMSIEDEITTSTECYINGFYYTSCRFWYIVLTLDIEYQAKE